MFNCHRAHPGPKMPISPLLCVAHSLSSLSLHLFANEPVLRGTGRRRAWWLLKSNCSGEKVRLAVLKQMLCEGYIGSFLTWRSITTTSSTYLNDYFPLPVVFIQDFSWSITGVSIERLSCKALISFTFLRRKEKKRSKQRVWEYFESKLVEFLMNWLPRLHINGASLMAFQEFCNKSWHWFTAGRGVLVAFRFCKVWCSALKQGWGESCWL